MINVEALRVLHVETRDVDENIFYSAISNINCRKEELKYISYDFFDNFGVGIITNKQVVVSIRSDDRNIITKKIYIDSIGMVGVKNTNGKNLIIISNISNDSLITIPTNTDKYMFEIVKYLFHKTNEKKNNFDLNKYIIKDKAAV